MASWQVVENTSLTLVRLLQRHVDTLALPGVSVGLTTAAAFRALVNTAAPFISVFLYQIGGNAEMRNMAMRTHPDGTCQRQPLALELCYLVTAWGVRNPDDVASDALAAQEEARMLGAVLQACYDGAELERADLVDMGVQPAWAEQDGLQIVMESMPVDQHYRIWDAAELGYRLSLVYRVRVAGLDPLVPVDAGRVRDVAVELNP